MPTPNIDRAWSAFVVKATHETADERVLEGHASTPSVDRVGDVVEPLGAKFALPLPFLLQHDHTQPIGHVVEAKATAAGIWIKAQIAKVQESGRLKDRVDEAWHSFKHNLFGGLSIGFRGIDTEPIDAKKPFGGQRFKEWELFEVSAVTIPANSEASITAIRSIDQGQPAASGNGAAIESAPASGSKVKPAGFSARSLKIERAGTMAKITNSERIKDLEAKRAAEVAARESIHEKVIEENRVKDEAEQQQFDEHSATIKAIDRELTDCRLMEKELIATARPVTPPDGVEIGNPKHITISSPKLEPGQMMMKILGCQLAAQKFNRDVVAVARERYSDFPEVEAVIKAAVAPGTTVGTTWAAPLVYAQNISSEFFRFLVAQTFFGKIPGMVRVPFNSRVPRGTSLISAQWVGEGRGKPVAAMAFDTVSLTFAKIALIVGVTDELAKFSAPSVELLARDQLAESIATYLDQQFITPSVTALTGVRPASITNGADTDAASGTDITAVIHDIRQILYHFQEYNIPTSGVVLIMQPVLATSIGTMVTTLGQRQFPDVTADGGSILGIPIITSNNSPAGQVTAIHAPSILVADEGGIQIDVSREASVQLADNPTSTSYQLVSAFQENLIFVRAEQYVTYARGRDKGVFYLTGAAYGGAVTG